MEGLNRWKGVGSVLKEYIKLSKLIAEMFEYTDMTSSTFQVARALLGVADRLSFDGASPVLTLAAKTLMGKAKVTNKNTLYSSIDWLVEHGLIEVKSNGRNKAPSYILHFTEPLNSSCSNLHQDVEPDVLQHTEPNVIQDATPYKDRQGGNVVVVQFINKSVRETLIKNRFDATDDLVESISNRLTPMLNKVDNPDELMGLFNYVLGAALGKYATGNVNSPLNYTLSVIRKTVDEGTRKLSDFVDKQTGDKPIETIPTVSTDINLQELDLQNI